MALSLYDLCVPSYLQILGATEGFLAKAKQHFDDNKVDPNEVVEAKLAPDMLPFRFQIVAVAHHSLGALQGTKAGQFGPPAPSTADFAGLQKLVADAKAGVEKMTPADVNACATARATRWRWRSKAVICSVAADTSRWERAVARMVSTVPRNSVPSTRRSAVENGMRMTSS